MQLEIKTACKIHIQEKVLIVLIKLFLLENENNDVGFEATWSVKI